MPEPNMRPKSFRYWGSKNPLWHTHKNGQKSHRNTIYYGKSKINYPGNPTKYAGNQNPRQYGPFTQRIKNYGPYKIEYLQG